MRRYGCSIDRTHLLYIVGLITSLSTTLHHYAVDEKYRHCCNLNILGKRCTKPTFCCTITILSTTWTMHRHYCSFIILGTRGETHICCCTLTSLGILKREFLFMFVLRNGYTGRNSKKKLSDFTICCVHLVLITLGKAIIQLNH